MALSWLVIWRFTLRITATARALGTPPSTNSRAILTPCCEDSSRHRKLTVGINISRRITLLLGHIFMFCKALKLLHMALLPKPSLGKACVMCSCCHNPASRRYELTNDAQQ